MTWTYIAPILLLVVSNVFMTFAWVRGGLPKANAMVRRTISSDEHAVRKANEQVRRTCESGERSIATAYGQLKRAAMW